MSRQEIDRQLSLVLAGLTREEALACLTDVVIATIIGIADTHEDADMVADAMAIDIKANARKSWDYFKAQLAAADHEPGQA